MNAKVLLRRTALASAFLALGAACADSEPTDNSGSTWDDLSMKPEPTEADRAAMRHCREEAVRLHVPEKEVEFEPERIATQILDDGRLQITVHHARLLGLTVADVDWWFKNMATPFPKSAGGQLTDCTPYVLLDEDHVSMGASNALPSGEIKVGSRLIFKEIVDAPSGKEVVFDDNVRISKLSSGEDEFVKDTLLFDVPLPVDLVVVNRTYSQKADGVELVTVLTAGLKDGDAKALPALEDEVKSQRRGLIGRVSSFFQRIKGMAVRDLNGLLIRTFFDDSVQNAWKHHTIEEYGALDTFIPWLKKSFDR